MVFTLEESVEYQLEIKKSRFHAIAVPVQSEQQVKAFLEAQHDPSTTHQCWAWKIGHHVRFNDAGEPSGTAGRPILASIEGHELSNVMVLINRWFGGIKLGTGGLVRAYGGCAGQALVLAKKIELIPVQQARLACTFAEWAILQYELKRQAINYQEHYIIDGVQLLLELKCVQIAPLQQLLQDLTRGREQLHMVEQERD